MMENLQTVLGGNSTISFSEGSLVRADMYEGTIEGGTRSVYHLIDENDSSNFCYNFAMENTNQYIVRMYCKSTDLYPGKIMLHMESFNCTLQEWVDSQSLVDAKGRLDNAFSMIISDILGGIIYFHKILKRQHGEICAKNIYIIDGKAKLANAQNLSAFATVSGNDFISFEEMIRKLFLSKNVELIFELEQMCKTLRKTRNLEQLENCLNHPVLLNTSQRYWY